MKVHWVNGVEKPHKNKTDQTPNKPYKPPKHSTKPTIKTNQPLMRVEKKIEVEEKSRVRESRKKVYRTLGGWGRRKGRKVELGREEKESRTKPNS